MTKSVNLPTLQRALKSDVWKVCRERRKRWQTDRKQYAETVGFKLIHTCFACTVTFKLQSLFSKQRLIVFSFKLSQ